MIKYWYIIVLMDTGNQCGWRFWKGDNPVHRLEEFPNEIPINWCEITEDKFNIYMTPKQVEEKREEGPADDA